MSTTVFNRTHVVWSFDYSSLDAARIQHVSEVEVDAVRIVGSSDDLNGLLQAVCQMRECLDKNPHRSSVPIIVDQVRRARGAISGLSSPLSLELDQTIKITLAGVGSGGNFECTTSEWNGFFEAGLPLYIGNGVVVLMTEEVDSSSARLRVIQPGVVENGLELHCPLTRKSFKYEQFDSKVFDGVCEHPVDFFVLPGIDDPEQLKLIRKAIKKRCDIGPWLILKADTERVCKTLPQLLPFVSGVMISRYEIAMCTDPARIPMITKEIIQLCHDNGKIALVASDILNSMKSNATPTRAEVSDIANAAMDGADAVVLSEGLSQGRHADRGHNLAKRAIEDIEIRSETRKLNWLKHEPSVSHMLAAITFAAYRTAHRNNAKAIVCLTNHGNTSLLLASFKSHIPIFAVTFNREVLRRLGLIRGVTGLLIKEAPQKEAVFATINDKLLSETWLKPLDKIVFVSVSLSSVGDKASNLFTIQTLK